MHPPYTSIKKYNVFDNFSWVVKKEREKENEEDEKLSLKRFRMSKFMDFGRNNWKFKGLLLWLRIVFVHAGL